MHKQARQTDRQTDGWKERERERMRQQRHTCVSYADACRNPFLPAVS